VHRALPAPHRISSSPDWDVLLANVRARRFDAAIIDPGLGGEQSASERLAALTTALSATPGTPIVGYMPVTAAGVKAAHLLARLGAAEVVVRGLDDSPGALAATIRRVVTAHGAAMLVAHRRELFAALPPGVAEALAMVFHRPERTRSVADLARAASLTRRSLDRYLARAGLAPARTLLACARANAVYHLIAAGHVRPSSAAALMGYPSVRALAREFRALTGHVPSAVPRRLRPDAFAASVSRRLARAPGPP
jgi:AraC-like DNA-binding protein